MFTVRLLLTSQPSISCTALYGMKKDLFCSALIHVDLQISIVAKTLYYFVFLSLEKSVEQSSKIVKQSNKCLTKLDAGPITQLFLFFLLLNCGPQVVL